MRRQSILLAVGILFLLLGGVTYLLLAVQQSGASVLLLSFEEMEQQRLVPGLNRPLFEQFTPFIVPFLLGMGLISVSFMIDAKWQPGEETIRRGSILSVYLICLLVLHLLLVVIYMIGAPQIISAFPDIPVWAILTSIAAGLLNWLGILAVWNWRKLGISLLFVVAVGMLVVNISAKLPIFFSWGGLVAVVILVGLLRPVWARMR